jgi:hypothetical protein
MLNDWYLISFQIIQDISAYSGLLLSLLAFQMQALGLLNNLDV